MALQTLIVIGASAGGLAPLKTILAALPATLPAAVCVLQHFPANLTSYLPEILSHVGPLKATHVEGDEAMAERHVFVAKPGERHLAVSGGHLRAVDGPKENFARPAVDVLFRSAARTYGCRVVGVVLSGMGWDGTAGLDAIRRAGGVTVVQDPTEARFTGMPGNALAAGVVDHALAAVDIGPRLVALADFSAT